MKKALKIAAAFLLAAACNLSAQIGSGWNQYYPSKTIQQRGTGAQYSNVNGVETFSMTNDNDERCEARIQDDYTSGTRQFEGEFYIENFNSTDPDDDVCIAQVWLSMMMSYSGINNGSLRQHSSYFVSNLNGRWVKMNVYHNASNNSGEVWIDGVRRWSGATKDSDPFYHKYGVYNQAVNRPTVKWRNVKFFRDGSMSGGTGTPVTYYKIKILNNTNYVLNLAASSPTNGTNVNVYTDNGSNAQLWRLVDVGSGYVKIVSRTNQNYCLDCSTTPANGVNVQAWTYSGNTRQQWLRTSVGNGAYKITVRANSTFGLDCSTTPANGVNVQMWTYVGNNRQQWVLEPVVKYE
jgi:hypothetical protein